MDLIRDILGSDVYSIIDDYSCTNILMIDKKLVCVVYVIMNL